MEYAPLALPVATIAVQAPHLLTHDKLAKCLGTTEGKDKILKLTQFAARALADIMQRFLGEEAAAKRLHQLWRSILDARNYMWWGKSFNELQTCLATLKAMNASKTAGEQTALQFTLVCRVFFALRWAVENIKILGKFGFLPSVDGGPKGPWNVRAKWLWFIATISGVLAELVKLRMGASQREAILAAPAADREARLKQLDDEQSKSIKQAVAFSADWFISSNMVELPRLIGIGDGGWSDLAVGLAGSTSSTIQLRNLWPQ